MESAQTAGSVVALERYPVKSMMGEALNAVEVSKFGLLGDRALRHPGHLRWKNCERQKSLESGRICSAFELPLSILRSPARMFRQVRITPPDGRHRLQ